MQQTPRIVITPGEPGGIGPDLILGLASRSWPVQLVIVADPQLLGPWIATLTQPKDDPRFAEVRTKYMRLMGA